MELEEGIELIVSGIEKAADFTLLSFLVVSDENFFFI